MYGNLSRLKFDNTNFNKVKNQIMIKNKTYKSYTRQHFFFQCDLYVITHSLCNFILKALCYSTKNTK